MFLSILIWGSLHPVRNHFDLFSVPTTTIPPGGANTHGQPCILLYRMAPCYPTGITQPDLCHLPFNPAPHLLIPLLTTSICSLWVKQLLTHVIHCIHFIYFFTFYPSAHLRCTHAKVKALQSFTPRLLLGNECSPVETGGALLIKPYKKKHIKI